MEIKECFWCKSENLEIKAQRKDGNRILLCQKCGMLMVGEIPEDLSNLYKKDYFEKNHNDSLIGYENYLSDPVANIIGKYAFCKLFVPKEFKKYLDIGCADGSLVEIFKNYNYEAYGLDISEDAIKEGKNRGLNVSVSNLKKIFFEKEEFDFISAFDLIEHLNSPRETLNEVNRILKDKGIFFYSTLCLNNVSDEEFWFNNSLEHLIYYDKVVLTRLIEEIFGIGNVASIKVEINGISEIFGIAKKGKISDYEKNIFNMLKDDDIFLDNKDGNYYLSLLYNQLNKSRESIRAMKALNLSTESENFIFLTFINLFFQGRFFDAVNLVKNGGIRISLSNVIFWQTYAFVLDAIIKLEKNEIQEKEAIIQEKEAIIQEKEAIIQEKEAIIQEKVNELYGFYHSRIILPAIVFRNMLYILANTFLSLLSRIADYIVRLANKYLGEEACSIISAILHGKCYVVSKEVKNEKWNGPLISVVTPFFNHGNTIGETVGSVLNQTFQNFEYTIVNDGSTDADSNSAFAKITDPKIIKISQDNKGVAAARNNGIARAKGKYILCLDADDIIEPTYLEKMLVILESNPDMDIAYSHMNFFGIEEKIYQEPEFNPRFLYHSNIITTAAVFRRSAWEKVGGYKSGIGFEDWEFWISLVENGSKARLLPEPIFRYRRASESRYIDDKKKADENIKKIKKFHPMYFRKIKNLKERWIFQINIFSDGSRFINLKGPDLYLQRKKDKKNVLLLMPWLTFGGAETLVYNYCSRIRDEFNISIITGIKSKNEWENKFKEITDNIYHLPNLFSRESEYFEFVENYVESRKIDVIHIVHNSNFYEMLPKMKKRFPKIRVISTVFNTIADHFANSIKSADFIDAYATDNTKVLDAYDKQKELDNIKKTVICNGVDCNKKFNPIFYDRLIEREKMGIKDGDIAVYFIGRLSSEKNPDVFIEAAKKNIKNHANIKFFVIGDGIMRAKIEKSIKEFNNKNLIYLGYQTDIPRYLSTADIFVLPSKTEGFPLSNVEAMAMGVCVIASDVGGVGDAVKDGETGFLMKPNSSDDLAKKIEFVVSQKGIIEKISKNARKSVEDNFSVEILAEKYKNLYENIK